MRGGWKRYAKSIQKLPEVSLISSWYVPAPRSDEAKYRNAKGNPLAPIGICKAVADGISLMDLYFLAHSDIPIYRELLSIRPGSAEPQEFAADLQPHHIDKLAKFLREQLIVHFNGRGVGRRPRFGTVATFFPGISVPDEHNNRIATERTRGNAVAALRNTLLLAAQLGCGIVEAVGGSGVPGPESKSTDAEVYRELRIATIARSLSSVYEDLENFLPKLQWPYIALELEPGVSFLLQNIETFMAVREQVHEDYRDMIRLNVDIAHFFMLGIYSPDDLPAEVQDLIAHFHISDHVGDMRWGGEHSSDLGPETFHFFDDYQPWLDFAIDRSNRADIKEDTMYPTKFSGIVSVELEACNSNSEALSTINLVRRWIRDIASGAHESNVIGDMPNTDGIGADMHEGVLMAVDIGSSTHELIGVDDSETGVWLLKQVVEPLCREIRDLGGSVMSFTGDGFIALFERRQLGRTVAEMAMEAALRLPHVFTAVGATAIGQYNTMKFRKSLGKPSSQHRVTDATNLTLRTSLHWGSACIPTRGFLRDEIIGPDVVCVTRLCQCLAITQNLQRHSEAVTEGQWAFMACTAAFRDQLTPQSALRWTAKPSLEEHVRDFKVEVFVCSPDH